MAAALPLFPCLVMTLMFSISYLRIIIFAVGEAKRAHDPRQESWAADLHSMFEACTNSTVGFLTLTPMKAAARSPVWQETGALVSQPGPFGEIKSHVQQA